MNKFQATANASFMASNGKWLSKVRRFLACGGKSLSNDSGKRAVQERRRGRRKLKRGERNSFVSLFKEPTSSIEKILEDAETEPGLTHRLPSPLLRPKKATEAASPKASASCSVSPRFYTPKAATPRVLSPKATSPHARSLRVVIPRSPSTRARSSGEVSPGSPKVPSPVAILPKARYANYASPRVESPVDLSPTPSPPRPRSSCTSFSRAASFKGIHREESTSRTEHVFPYHHVAATKIQAAYRGYMSRMGTRSARGLVRLQRFVRGQSVRRQTANSTKQMQLLVRIKTRLQPQSCQMLECYALKQQEQDLNVKQAGSITSGVGNNRDWDDSILSKEEKEVRNKRKDDIVRNKERARTLLQLHQMSKLTSDAAGNALMDLRIDGLLWSWNWSELHLLKAILPRHQANKKEPSTPSMSGTPRSAIAPRNSQPRTPSRFSLVQTPDRTPRSHYSSVSHLTKYSKPAPRRSQSPSDMNFTDHDSPRSVPAYSVPRYMTPTASARAKMRLGHNFNNTYISSPSTESKRRLSYPLTSRCGTSRGSVSYKTVMPALRDQSEQTTHPDL